MKTKLLLSFCVVFVLSLSSQQAYAQFKLKKEGFSIKNNRKVSKSGESSANKLVYTFCNDEIYDAAQVNPDVELRGYLRIPAKQWKGCKITNVEFGFGFEVGKDSYMFISKDLNADPIVKQYYQCDTIPIPDDESYIGWKNVPFDEPYVIDSDDDLYVGVYTIQQDPWGTLGVDGYDPIYGTNLVSYRYPDKTEWTYQELESNLCIKVVIEGENIPQNHLRFLTYSTDNIYYKVGDYMAIQGMVINEGTLPVNSFDITYQLNESESVTSHVSDVTIQPLEAYDFFLEPVISDEGRGNLILTVANPNGKPDDFQGNTSVEYNKFGCVAKGVQKTVVIDEVVGTNNEKVPEATAIIQNAINNSDRKDNIIWIENHTIAQDEYEINGFKNYSSLYTDGIFVPAVNIDHWMGIPDTYMPGSSDTETVPALSEMFLIDDKFEDHLNYCLDIDDIHFSVEVECELIDEDVLKFKMTAKPQIEGLFPELMRPSYVIFLTEDSIVGKQEGVEGEYIHNHTPRVFINNREGSVDFAWLGTQINDISDDGFTYEAKFIIPDNSWNVENMNLICYLKDAYMLTQNAAMCPIKPKKSGIKQNQVSEEFIVTCNDGILHIDGEFDKARIFEMNGQILMETSNADISVSKLNQGIYCVLIQKGNRFVSEKFVIK